MQTSHSVGVSLALLAGVMAALASVAAKLAMTGDIVHALCVNTYTTHTQSTDDGVCSWVIMD